MRFASYTPDERMRWGITEIAIGLGLFLGVLVALSFALAGIASPPAAFLVALGAYVALFAVVVYASRRRGIGSLRADFGLAFRPIDLAIGIAIGLAMRGLAAVIAPAVFALTDHTPVVGNVELGDDLVWAILRGILITSLVAPIVEELFFRGLVLRSVRNTLTRIAPRGAVATSIVLSAVVFMLLHVWQSADVSLTIVVAATTLLLGLANATVVVVTGRLAPAIIAHVTYNAVAVALLLWS